MVASNYVTLLNTESQPKVIGVIVEYLQKCPFAYVLVTTTQIPESLIFDTFKLQQ